MLQYGLKYAVIKVSFLSTHDCTCPHIKCRCTSHLISMHKFLDTLHEDCKIAATRGHSFIKWIIKMNKICCELYKVNVNFSMCIVCSVQLSQKSKFSNSKQWTLSSSVIQRENVNKHITWNVFFLWQLFQYNHNLILADSAQAASGEAPTPPMYTALHYTLYTQHCLQCVCHETLQMTSICQMQLRLLKHD